MEEQILHEKAACFWMEFADGRRASVICTKGTSFDFAARHSDGRFSACEFFLHGDETFAHFSCAPPTTASPLLHTRD